MANVKHILLSATAIALFGCSVSKTKSSGATPAVPESAQDSGAHDPALPKGVIDWAEYVCSIPDPEAKEEALRASITQRRWEIRCPSVTKNFPESTLISDSFRRRVVDQISAVCDVPAVDAEWYLTAVNVEKEGYAYICPPKNVSEQR